MINKTKSVHDPEADLREAFKVANFENYHYYCHIFIT